MRKVNLILLYILLMTLWAFNVFGQTTDYEKGLEALDLKHYTVAMNHFSQVIDHEKFEIGGKELSDAYGYLAVSSIASLAKVIDIKSTASIREHQKLFQFAIEKTVQANHYKGAKSMLNKFEPTLIYLSHKAFQTISDSLLYTNKNHPSRGAVSLAQLTIRLFDITDISQIIKKKWMLYDLLGLAYYYTGNKQVAMDNFRASRIEFDRLKDAPGSMLHLFNYELTSYYFHYDMKNYEAAYKHLSAGLSYVQDLLSKFNENDINNNIVTLNNIENNFSLRLKKMEIDIKHNLLVKN